MTADPKACLVGLTGQSGAGKSVLCGKLKNACFGIIDCDVISHEILLEKECAELIERSFPQAVTDGQVDRKLLGSIVFSDKAQLEELNGIMYPIIMLAIEKKISLLAQEYDIIVLDAPTLFESGANRLCDITVGVISPMPLLIKRLVERDELDTKSAINRLKSQKSEDFFKKNCDIIIENDKDTKELEEKAAILICKLKTFAINQKNKYMEEK